MKNRLVSASLNSWEEFIADRLKLRRLLRAMVKRFERTKQKWGWQRWRLIVLLARVGTTPRDECAKCGARCARCNYDVPPVRTGGGWNIDATVEQLERLGYVAVRSDTKFELWLLLKTPSV